MCFIQISDGKKGPFTESVLNFALAWATCEVFRLTGPLDCLAAFGGSLFCALPASWLPVVSALPLWAALEGWPQPDICLSVSATLRPDGRFVCLWSCYDMSDLLVFGGFIRIAAVSPILVEALDPGIEMIQKALDITCPGGEGQFAPLSPNTEAVIRKMTLSSVILE